MDKLIEILEDIQPGVDFRNCDTLIEDGLLDSFAILSIVSELQDEVWNFYYSGRNYPGELQLCKSTVGYGVQIERVNN